MISGGGSGIGRAVAIAFASEGADVAILCLNEHRDARDTVRVVEVAGRKALAIAGDIGDESSYMIGQVLHPNGGEIVNG